MRALSASRSRAGLQVGSDPLAQLGQRGEVAQVLGELVVQLRKVPALQGRHVHLEHRLLARQLRLAVALGEGHPHLPILSGTHAFQLLLEARQEAPGAELYLDVVSFSAFERLAVHASDEVHGEQVAAGGRRALRLFDQRRLPLPQLLQLLFHLLELHLASRA